MRWTVRFCLILLVAWIAFTLSPFLALYQLSGAIARKDVPQIEDSINLKAFRFSLAKQLVGDYLEAAGNSRNMNAVDKTLAAEAGATVADPILEQLLTPEVILDLLDDGWPQQVIPKTVDTAPLQFRFGSLKQFWDLYLNSESRGFQAVMIAVPPHAPPEKRYRLQMRLVGLTWRLSGLDLPLALRQKLIERLPR